MKKLKLISAKKLSSIITASQIDLSKHLVVLTLDGIHYILSANTPLKCDNPFIFTNPATCDYLMFNSKPTISFENPFAAIMYIYKQGLKGNLSIYKL